MALGACLIRVLAREVIDDVAGRARAVPREESPSLAAVVEGLVALGAAVVGVRGREQAEVPFLVARVGDAKVVHVADAVLGVAVRGSGDLRGLLEQ